MKKIMNMIRSIGNKGFAELLRNRLSMRYTRKLDAMLEKGMTIEKSRLSVAQIEITTACNLRCVNCSNGRDGSKVMDFSSFVNIVNRLPAGVKLAINGIGEPLLHPQFGKIVEWCDTNKRIFSLITNGMLLDKDRVDMLSNAKMLRYVGVSLDGGSDEINNTRRPGSDLQTVLGNLTYAVKKFNSSLVQIGIHFTCVKQNVSDFEILVNKVKELGIRKVTVAGLYIWDEQLRKDEVTYEDFVAANGAEKQFADKFGDMSISVMLPGKFAKRNRPHCIQPWNFAFVSVDGEIFPCCQQVSDLGSSGSLGNIFQSEFFSIWNGRDYKELRKQIALGGASMCRDCFLRGR